MQEPRCTSYFFTIANYFEVPLAEGPSRLGEERSRLRDRVRVGTGRSERVHQVRSRALAHRPASHAHCTRCRASGAFRSAPSAHCISALLRCAWKNFFTPVMEISPSHLPSLLAGTIRTEQDGWGLRKVQEPADERDRLKLNRSISAVEALCAACFVLQH